jgi:outer membrane receptor for ferrienterochelin and colicins
VLVLDMEKIVRDMKSQLGLPLRLAAVILLSVLIARPSFAVERLMEMDLEQLMNVEVTSASKFKQKLGQAPSSVSVVTSDEIRKYGYRTIDDILRSLRGFTVNNDRNYSYAAVRGFGRTGDYNSRILLLVDGHRVNTNIDDSVMLGTGFVIDIDLIDRMEVVRGPSSSLYGSNAFFAVVNLITKKGNAIKGVELAGSAGSYDTYTGRATWGKKLSDDAEIILSGSGLKSKGQDLYFKEFDDPTTNNGVAHNTDRDSNRRFFSTFSYRDFTVQGAYATRTKDVPTASFGTDFNNIHNDTTDSYGYLDLKYEHEFDNRLNLLARTSYNNYYYEGNYIYSGVTNKDYQKGEWWTGEVTAIKTIFESHRLTGGMDYQLNSRQYQSNRDVYPPAIYDSENKQSRRWAAYLQDEFSILNNLVLNAGVRFDEYSTFGSTTNPRAALIYTPLEKTIFKLLYGTAFRAPNLYELYYTAPGQKGNPSLKPETIRTYEFVYEQYFLDRYRMTTGAFYYKVSDMITQVTDQNDGLDVFRNVGSSTAKGLEFELEGKWKNGLEGRVSYTQQNVTDETTRSRPVNSPVHLAKFNLVVPILRDKLFSGLDLQYTSSRKTLAGPSVGGYMLANFTLFSREIIKGIDVSASVYNLFDKKYADPAAPEHVQSSIVQNGINYRLKMTWRF